MKGFKVICNSCGLNLHFVVLDSWNCDKDSENLKPHQMNIGMYKNKNGYMHGIECQCGNTVEEGE